MFYKLSNVASKNEIEKKFSFSFKYPNLYKPNKLINGLKETILSVILMDDPKKINYAIWGLLPEELEDNWDVFQNISNTLNTNLWQLNKEDEFQSVAFNKRRCLIIVTGFFTTYIEKGKLQTYLVHLKNHEPFCLGGIYNQLSDGFITCSLLVTKAPKSFKNIPNFNNQKPLAITSVDYKKWLDSSNSFEELISFIKTHKTLEFKFTAIDDATSQMISENSSILDKMNDSYNVYDDLR